MGFFDSLINYAPYAEGVVNRARQRQLQDLALKRQTDQDTQNAALKGAQTAEAQARAASLTAPKPDPVTTANQKYQYQIDHPKPGPNLMLKTVDENGRTIYTPSNRAAGLPAPVPPTKPDATVVHATNRTFDINHPLPTKEPAPDRTLVQTQGPDGKVIYTPRPNAAGMAVPAKAGAAGGGAGAAMSGQTMQTLGRLGMSFNDLKQAIDQMDQYENTPGNLAKQTPFKQAVGAAAEAHPSQEAHGLMGALNNGLGAFVGAKAQEKIGTDDPEYRTYLNNKQRVATAFTELLPRPNQQLLQLEKGLSGADVGWNPELIKNIQGRRRGGLDVLKNILQQQGMLDASGSMTGTKPTSGARGAAPSAVPSAGSSGNIDLAAASPLRQKYDAAVAHLKAQKKSDAEIHAMLGDPPGDE